MTTKRVSLLKLLKKGEELRGGLGEGRRQGERKGVRKEDGKRREKGTC